MGRLRNFLDAARNAADEVSETSNVAEMFLLELYENGLKLEVDIMGKQVPITLKLKLDKPEAKVNEPPEPGNSE